MKRREMLKSLGLAPLFGIPSFLDTSNITLEEVDTRKEENPAINYKGFDIRWSGILKQHDTEKITGFYTGWIEDKKIGFYACIGGYSGEYKLGYIFNTCTLENHKFLTIRSSQKDKDEEKQRALELLKEEIDNYYKPKTKENPEWKFGFTGFKR